MAKTKDTEGGGKRKKSRVDKLRRAYSEPKPGYWLPNAGQAIIGPSIPVDWTNWNLAYPSQYLGGTPSINYMPSYGPTPYMNYTAQTTPYQYVGQSGYTPGFAYQPQRTGYLGGTPTVNYMQAYSTPNAYDVRSSGQPGTVGVQQNVPGTYQPTDYGAVRNMIADFNKEKAGAR